MKKNKPKNKPLIFPQDIPPYRHSMLVCVGANSKDVLEWLKKNSKKGIKQDYIKFVNSHEKLFNEVNNGNQLGYAIAELDKQYLIMVLRKFEDNWGYWECLIHELSHILDWICDWKMLNGETEARAYLHEWLFKEIRRKLQGRDKI